MRNKKLLVTIVCIFTFFLISCDRENTRSTHQNNSAVLNAKWNAGIYHSLTKTFFLVGEQGAINYSQDGVSWAAASTPVLSEISNIQAHKEQNLLVGTGADGEVLRSVDSGKSWQQSQINVPEGVKLEDIHFKPIVHTSDSDVWLVAGTHNAIIRSTDKGQTWDFVSYSNSKDKLEILDLFEDSASGTLFFAAQNGVSGVSTDKGSNWEIINHPFQSIGNYIPHLLKFYHIDKQLFIAGDEGNFLISNDRGQTWSIKKIASSGYISNIGKDPESNNLIITTQTGGIFISGDRGESWKSVALNVENWPSEEIPYLSKMMYDEKSRSFIIVGNSGLIARSRDGGESWYADIFHDLVNLSVETLIRDDEQSTYVLAGLGGVIGVSEELSIAALPTENWRIVRPGIDLYIRDVVHIPHSQSFVAVGQLGGVWLSEDDANNWRQVEVDYPVKSQPPHLRDIILDEKTGTLLAAGPAGSIIRSTNAGKSWTSVFRGDFSKGEAFTQILFDEKNNIYYAAEVLYGTIYKSEDLGATWQEAAVVKEGDDRLWYGAVSQPLDLLFLVGQKGSIAIGKNKGKEWKRVETKVSNDLYGAYADSESGVLLAVGDYGKILRSEDGENWQSIKSGSVNRLRRVLKDPKSGSLLVFGAGGTVLRSENLGQDWQQVLLPDYEGELRSGFVNKTKQLVLVGQEGGVFLSSDSGRTWVKATPLTKRHLRSAAVNLETGTVVAVGDTLLRLKIEG